MRTTILIAGAVLLAALPLATRAIVLEPATPTAATQPTAFTPAQIDSLTTPIALFPDTLVTQILYAAAHPGDIPGASKWAQDHPKATDAEVDQQSWHPSVKALVRVPSVLKTMNDNPAWTLALGNAFTTQQKDVMASIARLRKAALAAVNPGPSPVTAPEAVRQAPSAESYASSQVTDIPQVTPVYQPAFSATYSTYVPYYPVFGLPYSLEVGPQVIITGGGGSSGTTIIQNGLIGGAIGPVPAAAPTVTPFVVTGVPPHPNGLSGTTSTSQSSFGYNPAVANSRRGNVSPFVNAPAAPVQSGTPRTGR